MIARLSDIIKIPLAVVAGIVLASTLFLFLYEGLRLPLVGQVMNGRVQDAAAAAVSASKLVCDAKIKDLTSAADVAALQATLDRERVLRRMADEAAAQADERAFAAEQQKASDQAKIARLLAEAAADTGLSRPNERDREWQAKH